MVYVGLLVQSVADAVAVQFPNNPITVIFCELLDGRSYVTKALSGTDLEDPGLQALPDDVQEFARPWRDLADRVRIAGIADPTAQRGADVYAHDVPISQPPRTRNTVDDLLIDRVQMVPGKGGTVGEGL
jgi:hypothetical protein